MSTPQQPSGNEAQKAPSMQPTVPSQSATPYQQGMPLQSEASTPTPSNDVSEQSEPHVTHLDPSSYRGSPQNGRPQTGPATGYSYTQTSATWRKETPYTSSVSATIRPANVWGLASLLLAVFSLLLSWVPLVGVIFILTAFVALVLGGIGLFHPGSKVTSVLGILISILAIAVSVAIHFLAAVWIKEIIQFVTQ